MNGAFLAFKERKTPAVEKDMIKFKNFLKVLMLLLIVNWCRTVSNKFVCRGTDQLFDIPFLPGVPII
jgi:hypothetical protein